jgi:hypothetical protein
MHVARHESGGDGECRHGDFLDVVLFVTYYRYDYVDSPYLKRYSTLRNFRKQISSWLWQAGAAAVAEVAQ